MKVSVYKWSQYYLMYSPVWRQLIKNRYNVMHQPIDRRSSEYGKVRITKGSLQQQISNNKQYEKVLYQLNSNKKVFNMRLSIAYDVLMKEKQQRNSSKIIKQSQKKNKRQYQQCQQQYKQISEYWSSQKKKIHKKLQQIIINTMRQSQNKQTSYINYLIQELLNSLLQNNQLPSSSNVSQISTKNNKQPQYEKGDEQQQQQLMIQFGLKQDVNINMSKMDNQTTHSNQTKQNSNKQNVYKINQLSKRILITQLVNLLQLQNTNNNNNDNNNNMNILYQVTSLQVITKILTNIFSTKLNTLKQQELNDWLSAILSQTNITQQLYNQINKLLYSTIYPKEQDNTNDNNQNFQSITKAIELSQQIKELISSMKQLIDYINSQDNQQGVQPQLYQQLSNLISKVSTKDNNNKTIGKQQQGKSNNNYNFRNRQHQQQQQQSYHKEIQKLYFIKQRLNNYINLIRGQISIQQYNYNQQKQLLNNYIEIQKQLQQQPSINRRNSSTYNNKNTKSTNKNRLKQYINQPTGLRYNLWKLNQLINCKQQIQYHKKQLSQLKINQIDKLIQNLFDKQISTTIQNTCSIMGISLTNKKPTNNNRLQSLFNSQNTKIQNIIYLGSLTRELIQIQQQQSLSNNGGNNSMVFMKTLYKISEQCNRIIFNFDVENNQMLKNKYNVTVSSLCVQILYNIIDTYKSKQSFFMTQKEDKQALKCQQCIIQSFKSTTNYLQQQKILIYAGQTQILSKLIKTLQKYLITNKQYILLTKQQANQLKSIINHLIQTNQNQNQPIKLLNKQSLLLLNKILTKIN